MNILYLGLSSIESLDSDEMYAELLFEFRKNGHTIYSVTSYERRLGKKTALYKEDNANLLVVKTLNIQKTNYVEKALASIFLPVKYKEAIKKHFKNTRFDLILYPTPPITLYSVVKYFKKKHQSKTYLMLKDIFPQNAVDLGMMHKNGIGFFVYHFFRKKERKLYKISDFIGCMSPNNISYLLEHNDYIDSSKAGLCPNCTNIDNLYSIGLSRGDKTKLLKKYNIPTNRKLFIYGGNLGKPQGIDFLLTCLDSQKDNLDVFFIIVGGGTEFNKISQYIDRTDQNNVLLLPTMRKNDYEQLASCCDVGLLFLDYRFTISNYPSRLLSYMRVGLPILACTDKSSDIGDFLIENGIGWWCPSNNVDCFDETIEMITKTSAPNIKEKELILLRDKFSTKVLYKTIIKQIS